MARTAITQKIFDSEVSPFIEQKDVILCRSGIQWYHKSELLQFMDGNPPPVDKEWYAEYRPANVVVKAQDKCRALPVTKEHPDVWVTPDNWKDLAGGVLDNEVSVVALDDEADGEIGLKSNVTFFTRELHDYYLENKEVSLGYTCKKRWVEDPEAKGYDIILEEITEVNHLAITKSGRGGSKVAVIDSLIGGIRPMRTGIFAWLKNKKAKQADSNFSFGKTVFTALKDSKGVTEEEIAKEMQSVLDSASILKDCEAKDTMLDVVRDCFDNKEKALENEEELTATLDSMWVDIHGDSLTEMAKAFDKLKGKKEEEKPAENKDSDPDDKGDENKDSDEADNEDSEKEDENKDSDEEKKDDENKDSDDKEDKKEDGCNKDSAPVINFDANTINALVEALKPSITTAVKEVLGINKDSTPKGGEIDNANHETEAVSMRDYSSFLD